MAEKEERYCLDCEFRKNKSTNRNDFCEIGYKMNPRSEKATENVLLNGGEVCRFNSWRDKIKKEMFVKHGVRRIGYADIKTR